MNFKLLPCLTAFLLFLSLLGFPLGGCAQVRASGDEWKEEVLLHDGQKIIVKRSQTYGGRHELGQSLPVKEHTITLTLPTSGRTISWTSGYDDDLGRADFNLLALHLKAGTPYLVAAPNLCLSYNKWGRPNPPYVLFKYDGAKWRQIQMADLPLEFKTINLIVNTLRIPEIQDGSKGTGFVPAESVRRINKNLRNPELKMILREPLPKPACEERMLYKGHWILPNDSTAQKLIDLQPK